MTLLIPAQYAAERNTQKIASKAMTDGTSLTRLLYNPYYAYTGIPVKSFARLVATIIGGYVWSMWGSLGLPFANVPAAGRQGCLCLRVP
jgi:hypothetical protein